MGITGHSEIQALSRTPDAKFQNFLAQAPNPFSRTFQDLEKWRKIFQGLIRKSVHPAGKP